MGRQSPRSSLVTTAAIAVTAFALCDLVHEVVGHGLVALVVPGVRVVSLSSVALQTTGNSRIVAAAGSIANVLVGSAALAHFYRRVRFSSGAYFFWLFGSLNLMNGCGYPLYSAVLGSGDWDLVVRGLQPAWAWRLGIGLCGTAAYVGAVLLSTRELAATVTRDTVALAEIPRLVFPAYVVGSTLLVAASVFNPIGASLILVSGVSSGFAAMAGLTVVPRLIEDRVADAGGGDSIVSYSSAWIAVALVVGTAFVAILGPSIQF
jgi:hypothetical protein